MDSKLFTQHEKVDWNAIGLKSGLEIHQQLKTDRKLFCRCPAGHFSEKVDAKVLRHMRPTLSELGEYDGTALMEFKTKKNIIYLMDRNTVCTYEMDDTPPFEINRDAIDIGLEIALALKCKIVGEIHVIRKQYLDGSIPTGFQRTAILGVDGEIPFRGRKIGIIQLSVEEDSCREVSDVGHDITFRTDRLSMPLVEVVTHPHMVTPEEVATVTKFLGRIMRSTHRVRRGAGASREDVNVSATGGTRIEIKGVPSISFIPALVGNEALRQRALLELRDELVAAGMTAEGLRHQVYDVAHLFKETRCAVIAGALSRGHVVKAVRVDGMRRALARQVGPSWTFADEIGGRVRVIACLDEPPILIHQGNLAAAGVSGEEWRTVRRRLRAKAEDAVILVRGPVSDVECAIREIVDRVRELFAGIPGETRQVRRDGGTDFERILPGPDRMYPDTDSAPIPVPEAWLTDIKGRMAPPIWETDARLASLGLPPDVVDVLGISPRLPVFDHAVARGVRPLVAGALLTRVWRGLERRGNPVTAIDPKALDDLFAAAAAGEVTADALPALLADLALEPGVPVRALLARREISPLAAAGLAARLDPLLAKVEAPRTRLPAARVRYYMGAVMPSLLGSIAGAAVHKAIAAAVENGR
ncbi:MAG: Glu-tRNA(Gln) amidotransferase subunit GatE [Proteobacteria bacterium]|jgi:glutamyl-tRNA(Gln) amidotransferase subunit E|nr:Glu-tRNA(Gln) amidotransferase subunit GatE [Pseudomonadota bacterium]